MASLRTGQRLAIVYSVLVALKLLLRGGKYVGEVTNVASRTSGYLWLTIYCPASVSYTHLDVYKRQILFYVLFIETIHLFIHS